MITKFLEAGQGPTGGNWGKFLVCRYGPQELAETSQYPGCQESQQALVDLSGRGRKHYWVLDLSTGEGARFHTTGRLPDIDVHAALEQHKIWVCPLFEPMLHWLFRHISEHQADWFETLPRTVDLPDAPFFMFGRRRPGPTGGAA